MIRKPVPRHAARLLETARDDGAREAAFWLGSIATGSVFTTYTRGCDWSGDQHGLDLYARLAGDHAAAAWSCAEAMEAHKRKGGKMARKRAHDRYNRLHGRPSARTEREDAAWVAMPCCGRGQRMPFTPPVGWSRIIVCARRARYRVTSAGPGRYRFHPEVKS